MRIVVGREIATLFFFSTNFGSGPPARYYTHSHDIGAFRGTCRERNKSVATLLRVHGLYVGKRFFPYVFISLDKCVSIYIYIYIINR